MTPLEHALYYAARGWRVIPIKPGFKYPQGIERWQEKATTDPERITRYWTTNPDHGIGIATGAESGLWVLDVDPDDGGDDSLAALEARHGALPDTVEAITGGGGRHLVFAWPTDGTEIRNSASGVLGVGLDVDDDVPSAVPPCRCAEYAVPHGVFDVVQRLVNIAWNDGVVDHLI
jgi:hypothetical protein